MAKEHYADAAPSVGGHDRQVAAPSFHDVAGAYLASLQSILGGVDVNALASLTQRIRSVRDAGSTVFIAGNGGSAATATHWVNDLCKAASRSGRAPIRAICLSDNVSWLTALANDEGYERVFARQMENLSRPGDLLVLISASGNSPNLLDAVEYARENRLVTAAFVGFDGGRLRTLVDECVWVETEPGEYGLVESAHSVLCDVVTTYLIDDRP